MSKNKEKYKDWSRRQKRKRSRGAWFLIKVVLFLAMVALVVQALSRWVG